MLTNDTIKRSEEDLKGNHEPDNVGSRKAKQFLLKNDLTYPVLIKCKDNFLKPDQPVCLPMERGIEQRIDIQTIYRQQWRLSPEQNAEIDKRRYSEQYDEIAIALFTLLKKKNYLEDYNFKTLKRRLSDTPVLHLPEFTRQKHRIIAEVHDSNYDGHPIEKYIADCEDCRRDKPSLSPTPRLMEPVQIQDERLRSISMDFITFTSHKERFHFIATTKTVSAPEVAILFTFNIWSLHDMPQDIVSDRDAKFISGFWSQAIENVGAKLKMAATYTAQGGGQAERMNRTLEEYLRCFMSSFQDDWDVHLANASFAISSAINSCIKMSPFQIDLG
ncbi:LOW QUALITY PROTEIN: Retrotransposable element tf2 [Phytophthora palmivora]|uniref:Retrotransposable element tf2 n=1 Tax=Phytophthora palmivora TaxID=4796 RepID=A0A2P4YVJ1_9STRA|nr:LOW QUALITY PROTEIN: Retrotransposable element tf2 [Phytophthora palmivora]